MVVVTHWGVPALGTFHYRFFTVVTVLPPGVLWQMPLCDIYLLKSIMKSGVLDFTIGMIKKVIHLKKNSVPKKKKKKKKK